MFAKINSSNAVVQYPYTAADWAGENPSTKMPTSDLSVAYNGTEDQESTGNSVVAVEVVATPEITNKQEAVEGAPVLESGVWKQTWTVTDKSAEEIAAIDTAMAEGKKIDRDIKLLTSDWTQLADAPITDAQKADYATYRQELRDMPAAADWPDTAWPADPHGMLKVDAVP
jgi:hypothetical protein